MDSLLIFYIMVALIFLLGGEMLVAIFAIVGLTRKMADMKRKEIHQKDNLLIKEEEIIEESKFKALKIIGQAQIDQKKLEEILENRLEMISAKIAVNYESSLESLKNGDIEIFNNISKTIEEDLNHHAENLKTILAKQTVDSQEIVSRKLDEAYESMLVEVEEYRSERLAKVDKQIYQILQNVIEKVLGKTLSVEDHQDLIIEALEKAKRENLFK